MSTTRQIAFPISDELHEKVIQIIQKIRAHEKPTRLADELWDVIIEVSDTGADFFFVQSLEYAKVGVLKRKAVKIGVNAAKKAIYGVGRKVVKAMTSEQINLVTNFMEKILVKQLTVDD